MTQDEIFDWLKNQRLAGNHKFFSIVEVSRMLAEAGYNGSSNKTCVGVKMNKLYAHGFLDIMVDKNWRRFFRVKDKYLKLNSPEEVNPYFKDTV